MPTSAAMQGKDFIALAAKIYEVKPRYMVVNKLMLQVFGWFKKVVAGTVSYITSMTTTISLIHQNFKKPSILYPQPIQKELKSNCLPIIKKDSRNR